MEALPNIDLGQVQIISDIAQLFTGLLSYSTLDSVGSPIVMANGEYSDIVQRDDINQLVLSFILIISGGDVVGVF